METNTPTMSEEVALHCIGEDVFKLARNQPF